MQSINLVEKYFNLTQDQKEKFIEFAKLLFLWNTRINVISRKDIDNLWQNHILHSLAIAKYIDFSEKSVIDVGTGGGLPGIPLAIMFPTANFLLIDSIGKKITIVEDIVQKLELSNVQFQKARSTEINQKFNFVVARAVASFQKFYPDVKHLIEKTSDNSNGIIYLKGEDFEAEFDMFGGRVFVKPILAYYTEPYFQNKNIIHVKI
jgi:16S rRNA (guanine527-N7)-methyltransferase